MVLLQAFSSALFAGTEGSVQYDFANGLYARQMYDLAISEYRAFIKEFPGSPKTETANYRLGECLYLTGRYAEAQDCFARAGAGEYSCAAKLRIAQCRYHLKAYDEAFKMLNELMPEARSAGMGEVVLYYLGKVEADRGNLESATECFSRLVSEFPGGELAPYSVLQLGYVRLSARDFEAALAEFKKACKLGVSPGVTGEGFFMAGKVLEELKRLDEAAGCYTAAAESNSDFSDDAFCAKLKVLSRMGKYEELRALSGRFGEMFPDSPLKAEALLIHGLAEYAAGNYERAGELLKSVTEKYPESQQAKDARLKECWVLLKLGKPDDVMLRYDELLAQADPSARSEIHFLAGEVFFSKGEFKKAGGFFEAAASGGNGEFASHALLRSGECMLKLKDFSGALGAYGSFLKRYPGSEAVPDVLYRLLSCYSTLSRWQEAAGCGREFLKYCPGDRSCADAFYLLGVCHKQLQQYEDAAAFFAKAFSSDPPSQFHDTARVEMAFCLYSSGKLDEAAKQYIDILKGSPRIKIDESALFWTGSYLSEKQDFKSAHWLYDEILKRYPSPQNQEKVMLERGKAFFGEKRFKEALGSFKTVLGDYPGGLHSVSARLWLGRTFYRMQDFEQAMENYREVLNASEGETAMLAQQGTAEVYEARKRYGEAARAYMKVAILFEHPSACPRALKKAAEMFGLAGERNLAKEALDELRAKYPGFTQ